MAHSTSGVTARVDCAVHLDGTREINSRLDVKTFRKNTLEIRPGKSDGIFSHIKPLIFLPTTLKLTIIPPMTITFIF
jgi:hypothetical protein